MKKYLFALMMVGVLACTSEESEVKALAIEEAKAQFQAEVREEMAKNITGKPHIQTTAVRVFTERSDFEVQKLDMQGNSALAVVQALAVPAKARTAMIEIMGKLDPAKERNFNVPDALKMTLQNLEMTETRSLHVYKVRLTKSDGWHVVKEQK
ncbi:hypothetical protein [Bdellovibrio sp. HCB337]|uniref:hypothetical protein n=1 Tax=Bdellovibrio sp. HCB337 TaxID=3394358 RepID=UPI0039A4D823